MMRRWIQFVILFSLTTACRPHGDNDAPPRRPFSGIPRFDVLSSGGSRVPRWDSLEFHGSVVTEADTLIVRVSVRNFSHRPAQLVEGCPLISLQLYGTDSLSAHPIFDFKRRPSSDPEVGREFCTGRGARFDIAPNDTVSPPSFVQRIGFARLAGDSLGPGRYYVGAEVEFTDETTGQSSEVTRVPAGIVQLGRP
jgi:hypothetical protein